MNNFILMKQDLKQDLIDIFFNYSPLLLKHKETLENYWDEALQFLNPDEKEYYKNQISNYKIKSSTNLIIYMYFLFSGCFYLLIRYDDSLLFEIGKKVNLLENPLLKQNYFQWKQIAIQSIYPTKSNDIVEEIFKKEFFPLIRKIILNDVSIIETNHFDFIENTVEFINKRIQPFLKKNIPVTITHFKFEKLSNYLEFLGNYAIYDFIHEIDKFLRSHLKKRDLLIVFSYDSYLVLSIGTKKEIIEERFSNLYMEVKNIVLDYHFYIETLYSEKDSLYELFLKLNI